MARKPPPVGPYSRAPALNSLDARTRPAKRIDATIAALVEHVGGRPSAVQARLIERVAMLEFHIDALDCAAIAKGHMTERDQRQYLAWIGAHRRALLALGLDRAEAAPPRLAEYVAKREAVA